MAVVTEDFEAGPPGDAITTSNTRLDVANQAVFADDRSHSGTQSAKCAPSATAGEVAFIGSGPASVWVWLTSAGSGLGSVSLGGWTDSADFTVGWAWDLNFNGTGLRAFDQNPSGTTSTLVLSAATAANRWLKLESTRDPVTGITNRRVLDAGGTVLATAPDVPSAISADDARFFCGLTNPALYPLGVWADDMSIVRDLSPVVRMFPRSDGRGMSSAPRIHPAPSSQRVIGGHQ